VPLAIAQTCELIIQAKGYENHTASVWKTKDFITFEKEKIAETTLNNDGKTSIKLNVNEITHAHLKIGDAIGTIYLSPHTQYQITFPLPDKEQKRPFGESKVEILFDTLDIYDINNLIIDFEERVNFFLAEMIPYIGKPEYKTELDTFVMKISKVYKGIRNEYFINYVTYGIAMLEMFQPINSDVKLENALVYKKYLSDKKIKYGHIKFMEFFNRFYADYFKLALYSKEREVIMAVNEKASAYLFKKIFQSDDFIRSEQVAELVMLKSILSEYHHPGFYQENFITILDSVIRFSPYPENKYIALNIKKNLTHLYIGYEAPMFTLKDPNDKIISLSDFKGKYVYLGFWDTRSSTATNELKLIQGLKNKYGALITFVSINCNENTEDWKNHLKLNPQQNWVHLHYSANPEIKTLYKVNTYPLYYLIGKDGKLMQSPAYRPTPAGNSITIENTFWEIFKKEGIKPNIPKQPKQGNR
jgi:peroxiredoxin